MIFLYKKNLVKCFSELGSLAANFEPTVVKCSLKILEIVDLLVVTIFIIQIII